MSKKIISLNLWYEKYGNKTRAQLKSFRKAGFISDVATIISENKNLTLQVIRLSDTNSDEIIYSHVCSSYRDAFNELFNYCISESYSVIYIRRLMSKLLYAAPFFRILSTELPIVYEIPTFPLDTGNGLLYSIRDTIEMMVYKFYNKYVKMTLVNFIDDKISLPVNWYTFHNALDIDNYAEASYPELNGIVKMLIFANISEYHHYERVIDAIKKYNGKYKIELIVVSPESNALNLLKESAKRFNNIKFLNSMPINQVQSISSICHIGVAQLSTSEKGSNLVNTLKSKDYCAMGLPFFSTCFDTSFEKNFPYTYVTESMDEEINLDKIIDWYINIRSDKDYRHKMYEFAKNNLQYDKLVKQITETLNI